MNWKAIAKRKYKQRIARRKFVVNLCLTVGFILANVLLGLWGWPRIIKKHKEAKRRRKMIQN
jgi:hypothetical protein